MKSRCAMSAEFLWEMKCQNSISPKAESLVSRWYVRNQIKSKDTEL